MIIILSILSRNKMTDKLFYYGVFALCAITLMSCVPALGADMHCDQTQSERKRCPAHGDETACNELGCHLCPGAPKCTEGASCRRTYLTKSDDCWPIKEKRNPTSGDCKNDYGCSWCKSFFADTEKTQKREFKCLRNLSSECDVGNVRKRCPANGDEMKCLELGCHFCPNGAPLCTEGQACRRSPVTDRDDCWPKDAGTPDATICRMKYGCSWCASNTDIKCVRAVPKYREACDQPDERRRPCFARLNAETCKRNGCHFCRSGRPKCIEGLACHKINPKQRDNCWPKEDTNPPNSRDCMEKYGCSWCKRNTEIKCVKGDDPPMAMCDDPKLHCYPFSTPNITEEQCLNTTHCTFCPDAMDDDKKCITGGCPNGYLKRYRGKSCCKASATQRIVGGDIARSGQWPWQVAIFKDGNFTCGGALIASQYVLTAAHCNGSYMNTHKVLLGTTDLTDPMGIWRNVIEETKFDYGTLLDYDNDIKLLKLNTAVVYGLNIQPISLPKGECPPYGMKCFVTGWGTTEHGVPGNEIKLREVDVDIIDFKNCAAAYVNLTTITKDEGTKICAGHLEGGKDACQGDSGGPLVCQRCKSCDWYLAGIVSLGLGCAEPMIPGIYTRVKAYVPEIIEAGAPVSEDTSYNCNMM